MTPQHGLHTPLRSRWRPLWPLLAWLCLSPTLQAQTQEGDQDAAAQLAYIRQLPYTQPWPELTGFSPARPVPDFQAPAGAHGHTQAYRSEAGCVAFFVPLGEQGVSEVALKWTGPACDGQPLAGQGQLQIRRRSGDKTVVGVLIGVFSKGVLTGQGEKGNFTYDRAGQPLPGAYLFSGEFANSVLHGEGMQLFSGAADAHPSAWARHGTYRDGDIRGPVRLFMLRPHPGVEGQVQDLLYADNGEAYIEQARVNRGRRAPGTLFMSGDPLPWMAEVTVWRDGAPAAAQLTRIDNSRGQMMLAHCAQWRFEAARLSCSQGEVASGGGGGYIATGLGDFAIPLPWRAGAAAFQPGPQTPLKMGLDLSEMPAQCDAELTRCSARGVLPMLGSLLYWHGNLEWRNGAIRPVSASLHQQPVPPAPAGGGDTASAQDGADHRQRQAQYRAQLSQIPYDPGGRDEAVAHCERFDSPLDCSRGRLSMTDGGSYAGPWRIDGLRYAGDGDAAPRYVAQGTQRIARRGWGTATFANGSWAEARYDADGDIAEVGDCDDPGSKDKYRCELDGGTVIFFNESSRQRQARRESTRPIHSPQATGGRFVPQAVPQRPVFVLPGMR